MKATVQYEDMSFTSLEVERLLPVEITEDEARKLTEDAVDVGLICEPFLAICGAYVTDDDKIDAEDEAKTFTCVRLAAEVDNANDLWDIEPPEELLEFVGEYLKKKVGEACPGAEHDMEGNWEIADIETDSGEEALPWTSKH